MQTAALATTLGVMAAALVLSWYARRQASTRLEFYLASRTVNASLNASAVCGDYFSAASFLGVAGAVYASGLDGVWFGVGFAGGFVPLLLFTASPLRRFGEYTLPDYFAARFDSAAARLVAVALVQIIVLFYLAPQMVGAGTVWELLVGGGVLGLSPYATGVTVTAVAMIAFSILGGMRGMTWNQALQFWIMLSAVALVLAFAAAAGFSYTRALRDLSAGPLVNPERWRVADLLRPDPDGRLPVEVARSVMREAYWQQHIAPRLADPDAEVVVLMPQRSRLRAEPAVFNRPGHLYTPLDHASLLLTLVLGTAGLPHVVMRFYTNPTGPMARRTTVYVVLFTSAFYWLASAAGVAGRTLTPALSDDNVGVGLAVQVVDGLLMHPDQVLPFLAQSLGGSMLLGYVAAGAFAAMLSTIGGLLLASAASWGHDVFEQFLRPDAPERLRVRVAKIALVAMALVALAVGLAIPRVALFRAFPAVIALMVSWAFAVSASGLVPVLVASIWWKGVTPRGAIAGMITGGGGCLLLLGADLLRILDGPTPPFLGGLTGFSLPTLYTAPVALLVMVAVSLADRRNVPQHVGEIWLRLHGTARERQERLLEQLGTGAVPPT
ncbi:MAG: cation acetate symporter [Armatimonadota bacterium]|nr:cation acetate symporter [Armatimonadota bacterium]MDR5698142.1 cation acetate symporter [Armatimonadota bacterium]